MSTAAVAARADRRQSPAAFAGACHHCGDAVAEAPVLLQVGGRTQAFCCAGCGAAAQWICDGGLGDYYALRERQGGRVAAGSTDLSAWDREDVLAEHARALAGGREVTVLVEGMRCAACAWLLDRALVREPGVLEVAANAITGRVRIAWDPRRTPLSTVLQRVLALGYRPWLGSGEARERERRHGRRRELVRLGIAGLGSMQAMMLSEALYLDVTSSMALPTRDFFRWMALLLSTPVVFYCGFPFLAGMARELRGLRGGLEALGMDTLVASAVLLAYGASVAETVRGGPHVWFDAAVMFVFLLLGARFLEQGARQRAGAHVDALARARPALASRFEADGRLLQVPTSALRPGDLLRIAAGETVPADGVLCDAPARFDEALLTGESQPVARDRGERVLAGSVCMDTPATLQVQRTGTDTWLSQLVRLVERAQGERPRLARLADRIAARFVAALLACAVLVFVAWKLWIDPARAFEVTLAMLVVSCPCALSLAVPAALAAAHGALARIGVLSVDADALEVLARADTLVLDKTGTLTCGRPQVTHLQVEPGALRAGTSTPLSESDAMAIAAALERDSGHPLGRAFAGAAGADALHADAVTTIAGAGVEGRVDGGYYRLGRAGYAAAGADDGLVWLGDGRQVLARFALEDPLRADAHAAIDALRALGVRCEIRSGDQAGSVAAVARALGIDAAHARQSPADKLARVRALQGQGHVVAMLGDGINDAPVLAGADVSLAMAAGAPLAHRAAGLVVSGESLLRVPQAIALARRTRRIVRQNLGWALGYNLVALPFAAAGMVPPWLAALGMAGSSLLVTLNALRAARGPAQSPREVAQ